MSKVAIVKGTNPIETTVTALELIGPDVDTVLSTKRPILIKPNYINARHPSTGITTDARVVEGIVKFLRGRKMADILIGEGSGWANTLHAFTVAGIDTVAKRWDVPLVDLNKDAFVDVTPPNPLSLRQVRVAKTAVEALLISVPKLKVHGSASVYPSSRSTEAPR